MCRVSATFNADGCWQAPPLRDGHWYAASRASLHTVLIDRLHWLAWFCWMITLSLMTDAVSPAQSARSRKPVVDWVRSWTAGQVQGWLRANGLAHLAPAFASITGKVRQVWANRDPPVTHKPAWALLCAEIPGS